MAFVFPDFIDGHDVRVLRAGDGLGFRAKPSHVRFPRQTGGQDHFQRHDTNLLLDFFRAGHRLGDFVPDQLAKAPAQAMHQPLHRWQAQVQPRCGRGQGIGSLLAEQEGLHLVKAPVLLAAIALLAQAVQHATEDGFGPTALEYFVRRQLIRRLKLVATFGHLFIQRKQWHPAASPANLWLDLQMFNSQPLKRDLSGLNLEYRIIQLYSRDAGKREAKLSFNVGQGTQDIGFRNEADILFNCLPAQEIVFRVKDESNQPTTAAFIIRDQQGRVYPSHAKRLAPDFAFHPQVYRADGETIKLPEGRYTVEFSRGPESVPKTESIAVSRQAREFDFKVQRWIDPSKMGWWSGDHHIHAAGCAHYTKPSEGVHAPDMMRHCLGEDLKVGANLTWGPCFDYQKQFFTGQIQQFSF